MSIVNLQRDAVFVSPEQAIVDFGSPGAINESTDVLADTDGIVYDTYHSARNSTSTSATFANDTLAATLGILMRPPGSELTPYRVKCYGQGSDPLFRFSLVIGYAEGTITGTDDVITFPMLYSFEKQLDELFLLEPAGTTGTSPIFFGIAIQGIVTAAVLQVQLSVQRLATAPPQFSQSVS